MAFKLVIRNKLRVEVEGAINDDEGRPVKFKFILLCKRLNQTEIDSVMEQKKKTLTEFLTEVCYGWEDVFDAEGQRLDFNPDNFVNVLEQPAMRALCFAAYLKEVGASAKN
jgi:hypothetical protein